VASKIYVPGKKYDPKEKWYGTGYTVLPMTPERPFIFLC
jgi:hypothetical protein